MDPEEARRGQADFVKVRDWRGGRGEVGDLEVDRVVASVPGRAPGPGEAREPLFSGLVARMQLLEAQGELGVAGEGRLPPPGEWALSRAHLAHFLDGVLVVHRALEGAVAAGAAGAARGGGDVHECRLALARLAGADSLPRSAAVVEALEELGVSAGPTAEANAYAQYLQDLGRAAGGDGEVSSRAACLKLVAHFFALHVTHATSFRGLLTRGSSRLGLGPGLAASEGYQVPGSSDGPVGALQAAVNSAGVELSNADDAESVASEVRKAVQKTAVLVLPLAKVA